MLASALLPLSFFFPILTSAALPPSFPWRPSNLGPPLAARQDDPTDYLQCQPFFAIADACLDRLTAAEQAAYDSEAPPTSESLRGLDGEDGGEEKRAKADLGSCCNLSTFADACFCTKAVFDTGNSCEAALGANSTAQNGFTGQLARQFLSPASLNVRLELISFASSSRVQASLHFRRVQRTLSEHQHGSHPHPHSHQPARRRDVGNDLRVLLSALQYRRHCTKRDVDFPEPSGYAQPTPSLVHLVKNGRKLGSSVLDGFDASQLERVERQRLRECQRELDSSGVGGRREGEDRRCADARSIADSSRRGSRASFLDTFPRSDLIFFTSPPTPPT